MLLKFYFLLADLICFSPYSVIGIHIEEPSIFQVAILILFSALTIQLIKQKKDNTGLKKKLETIIDQNKLIQGRILFKRQLIEILVHDIRAPISSISIIMKLMQQQLISLKDLESFTEKSIAELERINNFVEDILLFINIRSKRSKVSYTTFGIKEELLKHKEVFQILAKEKNVSLSFKIEQEIYVSTYRETMHIVTRNIIGNSVKFTPAGGKIHLYIKEHRNKVKIIIRDTGIGMHESKVQELLSYQKNAFLGDTMHSAGLGLHLCFEYLKLIDSQLYIQSKKGMGSTFSFYLKKAPPYAKSS